MSNDPFAFIGPAGPPRTRAPKREGHRTQFTVPTEQWKEVVALAAQAGTTPNDMLVRLAGAGLAELRRRRELQSIGEARVAAYLAATESSAADWPAYDQYQEAVARARDDDEA